MFYEQSQNALMGGFSYPSLSLDLHLESILARLQEEGLQLNSEQQTALSLVILAHEQTHFLQHCATSFGNATSIARNEWISSNIGYIKEWVQKNDSVLFVPIINSPVADKDTYYLMFSGAACLSWTGLAWSETDPYSLGNDPISGRNPLDWFLQLRGWKAPIGQTFPVILTGSFPNKVTNRSLLESAAFTAHRLYGTDPKIVEQLGPAADHVLAIQQQSGVYLLLERIRKYTQLSELTLLAAADLAMCPPIDAFGKILDTSISQWESLYPPWRFKKIIEYLVAESVSSHQLTEPSNYFSWADSVSVNLEWPSFTEIMQSVVASLKENIIEDRMKQAWTNGNRQLPLGINIFGWSSGPSHNSPLIPLFTFANGTRIAHVQSESESVEIAFLIHMLTLFDNLIHGKPVSRHGGYLCGPRHFSIKCPASNERCGLFPGEIPIGCPEASFFENVLGCSPNNIRILNQ